MRKRMTRAKKFTFPIKKGVLSLINEKSAGETNKIITGTGFDKNFPKSSNFRKFGSQFILILECKMMYLKQTV